MLVAQQLNAGHVLIYHFHETKHATRKAIRRILCGLFERW